MKGGVLIVCDNFVPDFIVQLQYSTFRVFFWRVCAFISEPHVMFDVRMIY